MTSRDDRESERRATDSGAAGAGHEKQGAERRCERAAPSVRAKPCAAHQRRNCATCEELSLIGDDASDYEPCGVFVPRVSCELPEGHAGDHAAPDADLLNATRWRWSPRATPLVAGGQGRAAEEIADIRWVGVLLLVIVSGLVGALVLRACQVMLS